MLGGILPPAVLGFPGSQGVWRNPRKEEHTSRHRLRGPLPALIRTSLVLARNLLGRIIIPMEVCSGSMHYHNRQRHTSRLRLLRAALSDTAASCAPGDVQEHGMCGSVTHTVLRSWHVLRIQHCLPDTSCSPLQLGKQSKPGLAQMRHHGASIGRKNHREFASYPHRTHQMAARCYCEHRSRTIW